MTEFLFFRHFNSPKGYPPSRYRTSLATGNWLAIFIQIVGDENRVEAETISFDGCEGDSA